MRSSKRTRSEEGQNDWISQLPESILVDILSYLPTKDAVKMTLISRFRNLWTYIRCLSFDECAYHDHSSYDGENYDGPHYDESFLNLIRHVLILHERTTIDEFHLKFAFNLFNAIHDDHYNSDGYASKERRMASELTTWIKFSLRKQVKVLDIDLLGCGLSEPEVNYELPTSILTNNYLKELSLAGCGIEEKGRIHLTSLTVLSLKEIILSDKIMGEIIVGCPMLEELSLDGCCGLRKLKLTTSNIKRLRIFIGWRNEVANSRLEISCPGLKSLELAGSIQLVQLKYSSSISDASLYYSRTFMCERMIYEKVQMLLWKLAEVNVFIPCTWTILIFTIWELTYVPIPVTGWKSVEFRLLFTKWHLPGICSILRNSHWLETLTFYIYPGSYSTFLTEEAKWMEAYEFDGKDYWKSQNGDYRGLRKYLKTVMIYGYVTEPYVLELVEFLLKNALVLEKMVISTKRTLQPIHQYELFKDAVFDQEDHFTPEELLQFSQKLLTFPRASKSAVIQFC